MKKYFEEVKEVTKVTIVSILMLATFVSMTAVPVGLGVYVANEVNIFAGSASAIVALVFSFPLGYRLLCKISGTDFGG